MSESPTPNIKKADSTIVSPGQPGHKGIQTIAHPPDTETRIEDIHRSLRGPDGTMTASFMSTPMRVKALADAKRVKGDKSTITGLFNTYSESSKKKASDVERILGHKSPVVGEEVTQLDERQSAIDTFVSSSELDIWEENDMTLAIFKKISDLLGPNTDENHPDPVAFFNDEENDITDYGIELDLVDKDESIRNGSALFNTFYKSETISKKITRDEDPEELTDGKEDKDVLSEFDKLTSELGNKYIIDNINNGLSLSSSSSSSSSPVEKRIIGGELKDEEKIVEKIVERRTGRIRKPSAKGEDNVYIEEIIPMARGRTKGISREAREEMEEIKITIDDHSNHAKATGAEQSEATSIAFSAIPSEIMLDLADKIDLDKLINTNGKAVPEAYSNIINQIFRIRSRPDEWQVSGAASRVTAAAGIGEKTQFIDIWGNWIFDYATGTASEWGVNEGDTSYHKNGYEICCYICKKPIVNATDDNKVKIGSGGRERTCPEMEHALPCISAFTKAPSYALLNKYKIAEKKIHAKWKLFADDKEIPDARYELLKNLYDEINCKLIFDKTIIEGYLTILKDMFKAYLKEGEYDDYEEKVFDWSFEVIKYWLCEFAYSHHLCNQLKSNTEIGETKQKMTKYFNALKKRWAGSLDTKTDNIDKKEGEYVFKGDENKIENYFSSINQETLKTNLIKRFQYMTELCNTINNKYLLVSKAVTLGKIEIPLNKDGSFNVNSEEAKKIKQIYVMKSIILMIRWYKKQKDSGRSPGSRSRSRSRGDEKPGAKKKPAKNEARPTRPTQATMVNHVETGMSRYVKGKPRTKMVNDNKKAVKATKRSAKKTLQPQGTRKIKKQGELEFRKTKGGKQSKKRRKTKKRGKRRRRTSKRG